MYSLTITVSLHERYSLCRRNIGFPPAITCLVTYPSSSHLPGEAELGHRIDELLAHFPLLNAEVCGRDTREPYFAKKEIGWKTSDILRSQTSANDEEKVLRDEIKRMEKQVIHEPLWQVTRHVPSASDQRGHITVSVQHELLDGMGLLRLTHALLAADISDLPYEGFGSPRMEDTINIQPAISFLLPVIWRELVLPKLPSWLSYYLRPSAVWPESWRKHPKDVDWDMTIVHIEPAMLKSLRDKGRAHGCTVHSILTVAFGAAIWKALASSSQGTSYFKSSTPRNERDASLGHPYLTNNYVASYEYTHAFTLATLFWREATALSSHIRSPAGIAAARGRMGMLRYLPDDPPAKSSDPRRLTSWEGFYLDKFDNTEQNPYSASLAVSNLGRTSLPPNALGIVWGQGAHPLDSPFALDVIGSEAGTEVFVTWREGSVVSREEVLKVKDCFLRILDRLLVGTADPTLHELV